MTANRTYLTWPATWVLRMLIGCFFVAGMALLVAYERDEAYKVGISYKVECPDCQMDLESSPSEDSEAVEEEVRMPPGFTVSWVNDGFRYCMRSGIAHYSLPPE